MARVLKKIRPLQERKEWFPWQQNDKSRYLHDFIKTKSLSNRQYPFSIKGNKAPPYRKNFFSLKQDTKRSFRETETISFRMNASVYQKKKVCPLEEEDYRLLETTPCANVIKNNWTLLFTRRKLNFH